MKTYMFGEETDNVWTGPDFIHEIKDSELNAQLSSKYWYGVLTGMTVTTVSFAAAAIFFW